MSVRNRIRWSENDRHFGPFTLARDGSQSRSFGVVIKSADDDDSPAHGRIHLFGLTFLCALPNWLIRPYREKVKFTHISDEEIARFGRDWYWKVDRRAFGFCFADGALHLDFGRQTHDSSTDRSKCIFLPWREWRHVRHTLCNLQGKPVVDLNVLDWEERHAAIDTADKASFAFRDFDGEVITAIAYIEEQQWKRGTGWCKWLSLFWPDKVRRDMGLQFSSEVGRRKGSWKGGTIGHSIEMRPGETPAAAFIRYCKNEGLVYIGDGA